MQFEIDTNVAGQYIWRLRADNRKIIADGESHPYKQNCQHAITLVETGLWNQYEFYADHRGEWRFTIRALNHEIIAQSSEGYRNRQDCEHAARLVYSTNLATPVVDLTILGTLASLANLGRRR